MRLHRQGNHSAKSARARDEGIGVRHLEREPHAGPAQRARAAAGADVGELVHDEEAVAAELELAVHEFVAVGRHHPGNLARAEGLDIERKRARSVVDEELRNQAVRARLGRALGQRQQVTIRIFEPGPPVRRWATSNPGAVLVEELIALEADAARRERCDLRVDIRHVPTERGERRGRSAARPSAGAARCGLRRTPPRTDRRRPARARADRDRTPSREPRRSWPKTPSRVEHRAWRR